VCIFEISLSIKGILCLEGGGGGVCIFEISLSIKGITTANQVF
jgi:hypothetical protein